MQIGERLRQLADAEGVDLFGIADLAPARTAMLRFGQLDSEEYPYAISLGLRIPDAIVDQLPERRQRRVSVSYRAHGYELLNTRLDIATSKMASLLQREGFRALPIPSSRRADSATLSASFSNKMAAHLAGLGWIGKSCLLVTPQFGPRVRWATVLTSAPVQPTGSMLEQRCGSCHECVDICPPHAIKGRNFVLGEDRERRYDAHACERYLNEMEKADDAVCGMCLYICPHGRARREPRPLADR
jgi:epoxyqueuosine reductase QueG